MRRPVRSLVVTTLAAIVLGAGAGRVAAQESEGEGDGFVPGETTTVPATVPVDGEEIPPVGTDVAPPTTAAPDATTTTALPAGCSPPPVPHAVFVGRLAAADQRTARFTVVELRSGSLSGFQIGELVDVDFEDDVRYLETGEEYLVAVGINDESGRLESKAKPALPRFGGDQVVGVDDRDVVCPRFDDPAITRMADGSAVETGVFAPMFGASGRVLAAVLKPASVALGVLVGIVALKHLLVWSTRRFRRWWRRRRAVAVLSSPRGQPTTAAR